MPHTIYQTKGIVLSKKDFGEADRLFNIYTEKFGKIAAVAQGVRQLKSKLRFALNSASIISLGIVLGKKNGSSLWRITDAEEIKNLPKIKENAGKTELFSRILGLVNRMVQGEEKNGELWEELIYFSEFLNKEDLKKEDLYFLEISAGLRILHFLGYIGETGFAMSAPKDFYATKENLQKAGKHRAKIVALINKAIKESQL